MQKRIFTSYRREKCADRAGRLHDNLVEYFEPGAVFKDIESIFPEWIGKTP
ncbi:hypothetical protein AWB65_06385 [Caballeronia humi]|uniref:Uncharacterized protein n=1 Tax=Caballeronia humi TaxID=326474 RepID=A0A158JEF5_9BURK|nr:hypothetical protein AWB65_06385 [Caballeronia humi]